MNNRKTQQTKCLEYIRTFKCCTVGDLNDAANSNYSHFYITKMVKAGILSPDTQKNKTKTGYFYMWFAMPIDWNQVDMQKCVLNT